MDTTRPSLSYKKLLAGAINAVVPLSRWLPLYYLVYLRSHIVVRYSSQD